MFTSIFLHPILMHRTGFQLRRFGTHDGPFHGDEVTACALLLLTNRIEENLIVRTRDASLLASCEYICDVGGVYDPTEKLFDHHQVSYQGALSSAGMILLYLRDEGDLTEGEYDYLAENLVIGIDAIDNGHPLPMGFCSFSHVISSWNPVENTAPKAQQDAAFHEAVRFTQELIQRFFLRYRYIHSCQEVVAQAMKERGVCLFFEREIPWQESFFALGGEQHPALFLIMPAGPHWKLRGIPPSIDQRMKVRHPLPKEWAGLLNEDLKRASGIDGAVFCHKGRFVSVWETKEAALQALDYTLQRSEG